jgi:hypothetical protein
VLKTPNQIAGNFTDLLKSHQLSRINLSEMTQLPKGFFSEFRKLKRAIEREKNRHPKPERKTAKARFWAKVKKSEGCWEWTAATNGRGYGQFYVGNGRRTSPHRYSWELYNRKPVPEGLYVCHHCDNPRCVKPHHLFLGTAQDNTDDMVAKGRARGPAKKYRSEV